MHETAPANGKSMAFAGGLTRKAVWLVVLAVSIAEPGMAEAAATADGPVQVPSALHAIVMLAVFFALASLRISWSGGRPRLRFELSPVPQPRAASKRK